MLVDFLYNFRHFPQFTIGCNMSSTHQKITRQEFRAVVALASIMFVRMLGLFMILPVFALYAEHLNDVTPFLVGTALGIYGFTQAILQIPFGMLSDKFGRKPIITIGLIIFILGSIVAALSDSIIGVIIGRAMQGGGAIAAAIIALASDLTREEHRTHAMAMMGTSMGLSFILALALGPFVSHFIGVQGIFWVTAILGIGAILILHLLVPQPLITRFHRDSEPTPALFSKVLSNPELLRLNAGILLLHCSLTSLFVVLPLILNNYVNAAEHSQIYLPVLVAAIIVMIPFIIYAEKYRHLKFIFSGAVAMLGLSQLGLFFFHNSLFNIILWLFLFFTAFNVLEASLPSLVSKISPPESKGTAMGFYSTSQFLGTFLGGMGGGYLHHHYGDATVFAFCAALVFIWFLLAITMKNPRYLSSHLLNVGTVTREQAVELTEQLRKIPGVAEAIIIIEDGVAYLKVDRKILDDAALDKFSIPEEALS
jgi:predicted MFS family arabinose efflux permease